MGPPDVVDSSLRDAYFNADDLVGFVDAILLLLARRNKDDTASDDVDVHVGDGSEWCAMPRSKEERGDTKALLNSVTVVEGRVSKATRSHGGVLRSRVAAGAEVVIVPCPVFFLSLSG